MGSTKQTQQQGQKMHNITTTPEQDKNEAQYILAQAHADFAYTPSATNWQALEVAMYAFQKAHQLQQVAAKQNKTK